ncbi:branched-chain amino acid transport system II carrier protein [Comamonas sp. w2-DMI]|uniref:branched-chain amino acid transport system II carrier protein n=1 Tax=Comamonas sp. w2-DMI TaxID=3126391 RepID=UPI0032E4095C
MRCSWAQATSFSPPVVGKAAGGHLWGAAAGFLLTGVGLPLLTVVAMARVGGGIKTITAPIGTVAGTVLGIAVYLCIGPFFATPRTATVSFELGIAPLTGSSPTALFAYSVAYFGLTMLLSLYPGKLVDNIGKLITPVLIVALAVLGSAAFMLPAGGPGTAAAGYQSAGMALGQGFLQGYQTMDALAALVFGIVIINAIRDCGICDARLHTRYAIIAGIMAATGLGLVYVSLVYLGATSGALAPDAATGVQLLTSYVQHTFGRWGMVLLAVVILLACLTTGVGLVSACATYFGQLTGWGYRRTVVAISLFSLAVSNQGLEQLIALAEPVLVAIYPPAIALVVLSLLSSLWKSPAGSISPPCRGPGAGHLRRRQGRDGPRCDSAMAGPVARRLGQPGLDAARAGRRRAGRDCRPDAGHACALAFCWQYMSRQRLKQVPKKGLHADLFCFPESL